MDYGVEVPSYRRIDNEKKTKKINDAPDERARKFLW